MSLCYNTGGGNSIISESPLVKYLKGLLTEEQAREQYSSYYIKAGGSVNQGLINRRNAEADLFFSETLSVIPGKPAFHSLQSKYPENTEITFTWDATENATHYNFYLYKKSGYGDWYVIEQSFYVQSGFSRTLEEGSYRALLQAYNSEEWNDDYTDWLYTESDFVYFDVWGAHTCDMNGPFRYVWKTHPHYNCYECSVCGEVHENREEPTLLSGCEICLENHEHDRGEYLWVWAAHPHYRCYRCSFCGQEWADFSQPTVSDACIECHRPSKPFCGRLKIMSPKVPVTASFP